MSNIMFFCIPAHGHTNPTIGVVRELVKLGHCVRYYSFTEFQEKIEAAGAEFVACDSYLPPAPDDLDEKVGKDFASLIEMVADTTIALDPLVKEDIAAFHPDCIISDSVCFWGKLFAWKYQIPFVCSTTTMAFNQHTAKLMKQSFTEIIRMFTGMPRIQKKMEYLRQNGYQIENFVSIIQNDNETNTIVYTSSRFQPMAETFSKRYLFAGPSVAETSIVPICPTSARKKRPQIYVSLGTVLNNNIEFYRNCIKAFSEIDCQVVLSVGKNTDLSKLGEIPAYFTVLPYVNQLEVLAKSDVFVTHCGMNSVQESLYLGVPMVLFPQHSEEYAVAHRAEELGTGVRIKRASVKTLKKAVQEVIKNPQYKKNAMEMRENFMQCAGPAGAAAWIEKVIPQKEEKAEAEDDRAL
ncbi:MAG: glucosyltransferase [Lachnospiraceae bacterium]|nr:glucosyltransferase [Lachnospiraceae bacterium]